jgi:bacteriocin-like protein
MSLADVERFSKATPAAAGLLADDTPASLQAAVELAAASGYGFTVEEARAFVRRQAVNPEKELSDEQLEKVTGGMDLREPD